MIFDILMVVTNLIVGALHVIGFWLLYVTKKTQMSRNQKIFLMNLSLSEFCLCVLAAVEKLLDFFEETTVRPYLLIINYTIAPLNLFLVMMFLTVDRFFEVYLNLRYPLYWSGKQSRTAMAITWFFSIISGIVAIVYPQPESHLWCLFYLYIYPTCDFIYIFTAAVTYGYILRKINTNKKTEKQLAHFLKETSSGTASLNRKSIRERCRQGQKRSRLFVPSLIMITFILFIVLPDQVHFYFIMFGVKLPDIANSMTFISYSVSHASDVIIYVFLSPSLKKTLLLRCSRLSKRRFRNRVSSI